MPYCNLRHLGRTAGSIVCILGLASCAPDWRWCLLDGTCGGGDDGTASFVAGDSEVGFADQNLSERNFLDGVGVEGTQYRAGDVGRTPRFVDFNRDGKPDFVVGYYNARRGVVEILLSYGATGTVNYQSLTLDGGENDWDDLRDVAVGDIDGDGSPDVLVATADGVIYLHHPSDPDRTHVLGEWGAINGDLELIEGTVTELSDEELQSILASALGPGGDPDNYTVTVKQGYSALEIADFNGDNHNDIAGSRYLEITLEPKPNFNLPTIQISGGSLQVLINPGSARTGEYWMGVLVGQHERHAINDREGATDLRAFDLDDDGDLDIISAAAEDNNAHITWYENPGNANYFDPAAVWTPRRVGNLRGAFTMDVADVTADGKVDVIAASPDTQQVLLFVQPDDVRDRAFDWYSTVLVTFEEYEPYAVSALDLDNDGVLEVVVGATSGALRYLEPTTDLTAAWTPHVIVTYDPPGTIGHLGDGDLDGDGDVDIVTVIKGESDNTNRVNWVRNGVAR
jgi:hypothetical protein